MKKLFAAFAVYAVSFSFAVAQTVPVPTIDAKSWVLLDATSDQVLASHDPDMRIEPASLAKLMTAYVVSSAIKEKRLSMDQSVNISVHAWKVDPESSKMFVEPNTQVKVRDLMYGLIVQSGNDAAVALSEAVGGTEDAFVTMMNQEAVRMGLKNTHFANAHGLPDPGNYSTARDLATLSDHVIHDHPEDYKIYSVKEFTYNKIRQQNRNRLLWIDPSVDGLKTGHTSSAGYNLIATAHRPNGDVAGERRLISVVIGTTSDHMRTQESLKLLNWGFQNFDTVKLYAKGQAVETPAVWKGADSQVKVGFTHDVYVTVPKGVAGKIKPVLVSKEPLIAPIAKNSTIGTLNLMVDDKPLESLPVVALEQVNQASIFGRAWDSLRLWMK